MKSKIENKFNALAQEIKHNNNEYTIDEAYTIIMQYVINEKNKALIAEMKAKRIAESARKAA